MYVAALLRGGGGLFAFDAYERLIYCFSDAPGSWTEQVPSAQAARFHR